MNDTDSITPIRIARTAALIAPYIRRTPVMAADLGDFGKYRVEGQLCRLDRSAGRR